MSLKIASNLIVFLFVQSFCCTAQNGIYLGDILGQDSADFQEKQRWKDLPSITTSANPIEIRFSEYALRKKSLCVLKYELHKGWRAEWQNQTNDTTESGVIENTIVLDSLFSILAHHNIFALPDDDSVQPHHYYYDPEENEFHGEGMGVGCGVVCDVEFKVDESYRSYSFSNPDTYADYYNTHHVFSDYVAIKNVFDYLFNSTVP